MKVFKQCICVMALLMLVVSEASAAGFSTYEFSARGNALGGAMVARKSADASSQAFNPALMTEIDGTEVMFGSSFVNPGADVKVNGDTSHGEHNIWTLPHGYVSHKVNDKIWTGFGVFSRYGLGTEYADQWPGRNNVTSATIQSVSMNPTVAYKINDEWSVGVGLEVTWFEFHKKQYIQAINSKIDILGDSFAYAPNIGVSYQPADWVSFGASYRATQRQRLNGRVHVESPVPGFASGDATGKVTLPASYTFGVCFYPMEKLSVETGFVFTQWSAYDEFTIESDNAPNLTKRSKFSDVWRLNVGAEYDYTDDLTLRAGYVYDQSPLNPDHLDYMIPADDRHLFSGGFGYKLTDNWTVDASYTYLMMEERTGTVDGAEAEFNNGNAHITGLSVSYSF